MVGPSGTSPIHDGLIDTGADSILASDLVDDYVGPAQPPRPFLPPMLATDPSTARSSDATGRPFVCCV